VLVARNLDQVSVNKRISRIKVVIGLVLFFVGSIVAFQGNLGLLLGAYAIVILGFILFNTGLQGIAKWGRKIRNDQLIDNELRRLSDRYSVIHYPRIGKRTVDHILVHETGLIVMTTKEVLGQIEVRGTNYRKAGAGMLGRVFGMGGPQLGQPPFENGADRKALLELLAQEAAARNWPTDVPVDGVVVFIAPRVVLNVSENADPPAVKLKEILPWVQAHTRGMPIVLPAGVREEVADFLIASGGAKDEGHIDARTPTAEEAAATARRPARSRPTTPQQVINARTAREKQANRPATEATPAAKSRRRAATVEVEDGVPEREAAPLVPASGMAKVKRRERQHR
jgi:hypothetical protein